MNPALFAIVLASVSFNAAAQVALRKAMLQVGAPPAPDMIATIFQLVYNAYLWLGLTCFAGSVLLWLLVLAKVPVSIAYPMSSIGYILATILAVVLLDESVSIAKMSGLAFICLGVAMLATSR